MGWVIGAEGGESVEDDGPLSVDEDAVFEVKAYAGDQGGAFEVGALADQVLDGVAVVDAAGGLFDDRPGVEFIGDVVAGGADEFDAALVRVMVRLGTGKGGEEAVVDVDDPVREAVHEAW